MAEPEGCWKQVQSNSTLIRAVDSILFYRIVHLKTYIVCIVLSYVFEEVNLVSPTLIIIMAEKMNPLFELLNG